MKINLAEIPDDEGMASSMMIASVEIRYMDTLEMNDDVAMEIHQFSDNESVSSASSIHKMDDAMVDQLFSE
eukprot:2816596-Ditylum_brightwellii.AAC.1